MSGSSSSYSPIIKEVENIDCTKINFVTSLTAPVASVVAVLKVDDMLDVQLISPSSLQVFNNNGELVGALISSSRDRIIDCIKNGFEFIGIVLKINGGNCEIRIRTK